jgi:hypothetical protein
MVVIAVGGACCADKAAIRRIGKSRTKSAGRWREQFRSGHRLSDAANSSKWDAPFGALGRKFSTISAVLSMEKPHGRLSHQLNDPRSTTQYLNDQDLNDQR